MTVHVLNPKQRTPQIVPTETYGLRARKMSKEEMELLRMTIRAMLVKRKGRWIYTPGNNDTTVAKQTGFTTAQVGTVRRKYYGGMPLGRPAGPRPALDQPKPLAGRVATLEQVVTLLCDKVYPKLKDNLRR